MSFDATFRAPGIATSNKKLLGTSASLVVTSALLVVTRGRHVRGDRGLTNEAIGLAAFHRDCQVVGSTAWGGEVPQSDLDLVRGSHECHE